MEFKEIINGDKSITLASDRQALLIRVSGPDSEGMYSSKSIVLSGDNLVKFFADLCAVMPGSVG